MSGPKPSLQRFKSMGLFKSSSGRKKEQPQKNEEPIQSHFLKLSPGIRMLIYEQAFTRTPVEHFKALHHGPQANSSSGLMLVSRQVRNEVKELYRKDALIELWPHFFKDGQQTDRLFAQAPPVIASWRKSRHGKLLKHHPDQVHQLGLLINLTREDTSMSHDYVDTDILKNPLLKPTDLYLRVCICRSLRWLHDTPFGIMSFCIALETFVNHFSSLQRIHVLYCRQHWPKWLEASEDEVPFPEIVLARHTVRMASGANWSVRRADERTKTWGPTTGRDPAQIQPQAVQPVVEDTDTDKVNECKLKTFLVWNYSSQAHPGDNVMKVPWKERTVEINYYDSRTILDAECVRDKPTRLQKSDTTVRVTRLTKEKSTVAKGATRVKDWVEGWHLGPEYFDHTPKQGGPGESGSHTRYYSKLT